MVESLQKRTGPASPVLVQGLACTRILILPHFNLCAGDVDGNNEWEIVSRRNSRFYFIDSFLFDSVLSLYVVLILWWEWSLFDGLFVYFGLLFVFTLVVLLCMLYLFFKFVFTLYLFWLCVNYIYICVWVYKVVNLKLCDWYFGIFRWSCFSFISFVWLIIVLLLPLSFFGLDYCWFIL